MKLFPKGAWRYAILFVILFSIAAIATWQILDFTTGRFLQPEFERAFSLAIWALTMGLMFLAGALGILAISATAESESRHRIARMVNRMNYLSDGLLALDYQGGVKGANPAARKIAPLHVAAGRRDTISSIFPSLTEEETRRLLNRNSPCEIESEYLHSSGLRVLRLRSQPVEGLILVMVSDITEMHAESIRQQQAAKLQLLGRIAGGVAHDFSNILSAISGHAVLMQRFGDDKRALDDAIGVVMNETQRGVRLSRQLLALSRSSDLDGQLSNNLAENVREAGELLRVALSSAWNVEMEITGVFPIVPLSPPQIVQIVLNLGLLAADAMKKPGRLLIQVKTPGNGKKAAEDSAEASFAAIITILASAEPAGGSSADLPSSTGAGFLLRQPSCAHRSGLREGGGYGGQVAKAEAVLQNAVQSAGIIDTTGVIPSVVRTLIEEAGGRFDEVYVSSAKSLYRVCLPYASKLSQASLTPAMANIKSPFRMKPWLGSERWSGSLGRRSQTTRQWRILLAFPDARFEWLEKKLADLGAIVEKKAVIDTVLGVIDSERKPDIIIADKSLFGDEADRLLKAVRKISPVSGIIIVSPHPEEEKLRNEPGFVFLKPDSGEETWLSAIVKSRSFMAQK